MKKYFLWIIILYPFITACGQSSKKNTPDNSTFNSEKVDANYLKKIKWHRLTDFVDFYIISSEQKDNIVNAKKYKIILKSIYHYDTEEYESIKDSVVFCSDNDLKSLTLNDSLFTYRSIDCLLKINSEIAYEQQPQLLKTIFLKPKEDDDGKMKVLINQIKSKPFVEKVTLSNNANKSLNESSSSPILNIEIKESFMNLKDVSQFCEHLRSMPNVDEVFITDFFTGQNKQDLFYRVTSVE